MRVGDSTRASKIYRFGEIGQSIEIAPTAIEIFLRNQQTSASAPEAGGLLFAGISLNAIQIISVTEPTKSDFRSRFRFRSSRQIAKNLIKQKFNEGLHFVGEWHTHPEPIPTPSQIDLDSMSESFCKSKHQLKYFIMIIVGNDSENMNLWVSLHNGINILQAKEV